MSFTTVRRSRRTFDKPSNKPIATARPQGGVVRPILHLKSLPAA